MLSLSALRAIGSVVVIMDADDRFGLGPSGGAASARFVICVDSYADIDVRFGESGNFLETIGGLLEPLRGNRRREEHTQGLFPSVGSPVVVI